MSATPAHARMMAYRQPDRPARIGDEGVCDTGTVPTPLGEETICLWRRGMTVLATREALEPDAMVANVDLA